MTQLQNQFNQAPEKGMLTLLTNYNSFPVQIDSTEAGTLVPGQAVKIYDRSGKTITVVKIAADTDEIFAIIPYTRGKASFVAGDVLEVASQGNVIYMEAGAAIARFGKVMAVVTGSKVITATSGKTIVGFALDKAAADGDLIRVLVNVFSEQAITGTASNALAIAGTLTGSTDGTLADVADIVMASALALSTSDTYTDAAVNAAVNAAVDAAVDTAVNGAILDLNLQLKELQVKQNEVIAGLIAAGLMAAP